jgi:hypothetical protein
MGGNGVFVLITFFALNVFIAGIRENGFCPALRWITRDQWCLHPEARVPRPMAQQFHYTTKRVNQVRRATHCLKSHNLLLSDKQRQPKIRLTAPWFMPIVPSKPQTVAPPFDMEYMHQADNSTAAVCPACLSTGWFCYFAGAADCEWIGVGQLKLHWWIN